MKTGLLRLAGKKESAALGIFITALLLFPSSPSVLCIAPGGHIAIEDINAACCVSIAISHPSGNRSEIGFDAPDSCHNCTDLLLAMNGSGALPQSGKFVPLSLSDAECPAICLPADIPVSPCRASIVGSFDSPTPASASVPLRC